MEGQEREQRLKEVAEALACRPVVEADEARLLAETEARRIRKDTVNDLADDVQLFKNDGYTVDRLMKDVRYRVTAALGEAGLQDKTYARELVKGLPAT